MEQIVPVFSPPRPLTVANLVMVAVVTILVIASIFDSTISGFDTLQDGGPIVVQGH